MADNKNFKEGDVVRLKSGSQSLTISSFNTNGAMCYYWSGGKAKIRTINVPLVCLQLDVKPRTVTMEEAQRMVNQGPDPRGRGNIDG